jgi:hypothetical protein
MARKPGPLEPLLEAKKWVQAERAEGVTCPCCDQFVKVYRRGLHKTMVGSLVQMYRSHGQRWAHLLRSGSKGGDEAKLRYWGLLEEETSINREDGGRAGYWRVTDRGVAFIRGAAIVPRYSLVFNAECIGHDGELIDIHKALGERFHYEELMNR